jgi:predicted permease
MAVRLYGAMLRLLPQDLRRSYGADARDLFDDMYRGARDQGAIAGLRFFAWATGQLIFCSAGERAQTRSSARHLAAAPVVNRSEAPLGSEPGGPTGSHPPRRSKGPSDMIALLFQDLRYAARTFAKKPAFALSAILILAVGIGATTTIFSVVDVVLLRSLPYPEPGRIVLFTQGAHSFPDYNEWTVRLDAFSAIAGVWDERVDLTGDGPPEQVAAARVTPDFFSIFAATPHLGRFFTEEEFADDPTVAVVGHGIWQRRWGADPSLVGKTVTIDGQPLVVVGIVGPEFQPPEVMADNRVDVWLPLDTARPEYLENMGFHVMSVAGRLADGSSLQVAQEQIDAVTAWRAEDFPNRYLTSEGELRNVPLVPLREATVQEVSTTLYLLLGAVGFMLLIACANVANLFLARGTERAREIALRGALGASRGRIVGQLLTESVAIAFIGGFGGVVFAYLGVATFSRYSPGDIPRLYDVAVDPRILGFAFLASLLTGVLFGILPALQAARTNVNETLKEGATSVTSGRRGRRTRGALVVAEIALALMLLVGAGLLFRSMMEILSIDPGFETEQLVDLSLQLGPTFTDTERVAFANQLIERLEGLPGTQAAAAGWALPFVYHGRGSCCWRTTVRDLAQPPSDLEILTVGHPVTPGYFGMLGAPLRHGRDFMPADNSAQPTVAIVNVHTAMEVFGTDNPVGRTLILGEDEMTVVGVVEGVQHFGLTREIDNAVYMPYERYGGELPMLHIGVRSQADFETVVAGMREAVWALEPDLPIEEIVTMRQRVSESLATPRFLSLLLGMFAGVALLLACGGIYGSMLYSVSQRQHEMGIRLALGADGGRVIRLILGHGLLLTFVGLAIGIAGAMALSRFIESLVWGIQATDPLTFAGVTLVLGAAALAACFFPAYKASRADPLQTLRAD